MNTQYTDNQTPIISAPMSGGGGKSKNVRAWIAIVVVVLLVGSVAAWALIAAKDRHQSVEAEVKQLPGPTVSIDMNGLQPGTIKIKLGQEVTWLNQDTREHQIVADPSVLAGFDSVDALAKGDSYTYSFDSKGTFHYYDPADPKGFNGIVIVE